MKFPYSTKIQGRSYHIPEYMEGAIERYVEHGIHPGSFLEAVICNDLSMAVRKADSTNIGQLPAYAVFFYWEVPSLCWGSPAKMQAWQELNRERER